MIFFSKKLYFIYTLRLRRKTILFIFLFLVGCVFSAAAQSQQDSSGSSSNWLYDGPPDGTLDTSDFSTEDNSTNRREPEGNGSETDSRTSPDFHESIGVTPMDFGQEMDEDHRRTDKLETDESVDQSPDHIDHDTEQILEAAARGQMPESPEVNIEPLKRPDDAGALHFTRKWYGEEVQERADLSNLIGISDMTDREVLDYVAKQRPDFVYRGVIDQENPEESLTNIDKYYQNRVRQRQRRTAHRTYFPELRYDLVAQVGEKAVGVSDEKLVDMYAKKYYEGQAPTDVADVVDDMIADGQQRQRKILKELDNVRRVSSLQEFIDLTSKLEQYHERGKKESYKSGMVVMYTDPDTGADLTFTSPVQAEQYRHLVQWRSLDFKDPTIPLEFASALGRTVIDAATFITGLAAYTSSLLEMSRIGPSALTSAAGELQGDLDAIRFASFLREGDELSDLELYGKNDKWYAPSGGAVTTPNWWASSVGEIASLLGPASGAVVAEKWITQKMHDGLF